jgi:hypothetical protein
MVRGVEMEIILMDELGNKMNAGGKTLQQSTSYTVGYCREYKNE